MEPAGWLLLIGSWAAISSLAGFCLARVLRGERTWGRRSSPDPD